MVISSRWSLTRAYITLHQNFASLAYDNCRDLSFKCFIHVKSQFHLIIPFMLYYLSCSRLWQFENKRKGNTGEKMWELTNYAREPTHKASPNADLIWILLFSCTLGNLYFLEEIKLKSCKRYVAVRSISSQKAYLQAVTCCSLLTPVM